MNMMRMRRMRMIITIIKKIKFKNTMNKTKTAMICEIFDTLFYNLFIFFI